MKFLANMVSAILGIFMVQLVWGIWAHNVTRIGASACLLAGFGIARAALYVEENE
jgi:hypothetical protein